MKTMPQLTAIACFSSDLGKVQKFYSAIGISWLGGEEEIGLTGLPVSVERCPKPYGGPGVEGAGLPDLWGDLGDVEFWFYLLKSPDLLDKLPNTMLSIKVDDPNLVIARLKEIGMYRPYPDDPWRSPWVVIDPDGRHIRLLPAYSIA
jgi:hypothetical protein